MRDCAPAGCGWRKKRRVDEVRPHAIALPIALPLRGRYGRAVRKLRFAITHVGRRALRDIASTGDGLRWQPRATRSNAADEGFAGSRGDRKRSSRRLPDRCTAQASGLAAWALSSATGPGMHLSCMCAACDQHHPH